MKRSVFDFINSICCFICFLVSVKFNILEESLLELELEIVWNPNNGLMSVGIDPRDKKRIAVVSNAIEK